MLEDGSLRGQIGSCRVRESEDAITVALGGDKNSGST